MKHLRYLLMAALVAMPLTACDEDDDPVIDDPIYGTVTGTVSAGTDGLSGVAVNLVGAVSQSATTGAGGTYTFTNVPAGSYGVSIDPSAHPDVSFSQVSRTTTITVQGETQTVDFSGSYITTSAVTGFVSAGGAAIDATVTLTGGPTSVNESTATVGGTYAFTGLRAGSYTVTISGFSGATFATEAHNVTVAVGENAVVNFAGELVQMSAISGAVTVDNVGFAGVAVALSGGGATETGPGGAYAFTNLTPGTYTVSITEPEGATCNATSKDVTVNAGETGVVNFACETPAEPATVSIQSITQGGAPVNLANLSGQVEVTLNITRNDQTLDYVDILIGDEVVATQDFAEGSPAEAAGEAEIVTLNVPTRQVQWATNGWTPVVINGGNEFSANLYVVEGDQPIPTNKIPVVIQNLDRVLAGNAFGGDLDFSPDSPELGVIGENDEMWYPLTATASGPVFLAYSSYTPDMAEFALDGPAACDVTDAIVGDYMTGITLANTYDCDEEGTYDVDWNDFSIGYETMVGPDGTAVGYSEIMAAIGAEFYLGDGSIGPRRYVLSSPESGQIEDSDDLNLDNEAPDVCVDGQAGECFYDDGEDWVAADRKVAFHDDFSEWWVKGDYDFVANDVTSDDFGVGFQTETAFLWVQGDPGSCTGTEVTTPMGTPLAETLVSDGDPDGYQICGCSTDALGNSACSANSNWFGVDMVAPSARIWGDGGATPDLATEFAVSAPVGAEEGTSPVSEVMNETVYGTATMVGMGDYHYAGARDGTMNWGLEAIDDRSGLEWNGTEGYPFVQTITHDGVVPTGATVGDDGYGTILDDNWVRNENATEFLNTIDLPGIYDYMGYAVDRAGNMSEVFAYNWLVDEAVVPATTAITPATVSYLVGQPAMFNVWGTDDLELMELGFYMTYPTSGGPGDVWLHYGDQALMGADRWDDVFNNTLVGEQYGVSSVWGRIDFTGAAGAVPGGVIYAPGDAALPVDVTAEFTQDAGYNPGDGSTATWTFITYALGGWGTEDDLVEAPWIDVNLDVFTITDTGTDYLVEQISDSSIDEFVMDEIWLVAFEDGGAATEPYSVIFCAAIDGANNVYSDNGTNRFYQYTFDYPDEGNPCHPGTIGVDWTVRAAGIQSGTAMLITDTGPVPNPTPPPA